MMRFSAVVVLCAAVGSMTVWYSTADDRPDLPRHTANYASARESAAASLPSLPAPAPAPRAEAITREFDFGTVEPMRRHQHTFEIYNAGTSPLTLASRGTSCKCLDVELIDVSVPPGGVGRVCATWNAEPSHDVFLQRLTITTNDPACETIEFTISGKTRVALGAFPASLAAPRIKPNQTVQLSTTIVSQSWDSFTIDEISASLRGASWQLAPADAAELAKLQAKSGWRLSLTLPKDLPTGPLAEQLQIVARPATDPSDSKSAAERMPVTAVIPIEGRVLRRLAVYGKDVQPWGAIDAGSVDPQKGYDAQCVLRVYDDDPVLRIAAIRAMPSFVHVRLEPFDQNGKPGIYRLRVHIPANCSPGVYQGDRQGKILLTFDHPRIESLQLGLEFVVPGRSHTQLSEQNGKNMALARGR